MSNEILNSLLKEYEQKKLRAEMDVETRKTQLYKDIPRLERIEEELSNYSISTAKSILANNKSTNSLESLKDKINDLKKEKEKILKSNNLDIDYLKPFYDCQICKDTGYIMDNNYKTQMCSCLKQKLLDYSFNKSNMSTFKKENFDNFNIDLFSDIANKEKYKYDISPRENITKIKNRCIDFIENFDNPDNKNLLFIGNTGLR